MSGTFHGRDLLYLLPGSKPLSCSLFVQCKTVHNDVVCDYLSITCVKDSECWLLAVDWQSHNALVINR